MLKAGVYQLSDIIKPKPINKHICQYLLLQCCTATRTRDSKDHDNLCVLGLSVT